jgi:hypothetical protein
MNNISSTPKQEYDIEGQKATIERRKRTRRRNVRIARIMGLKVRGHDIGVVRVVIVATPEQVAETFYSAWRRNREETSGEIATSNQSRSGLCMPNVEQQGKSREEFLREFPDMDSWISSMEGLHGQLIRIGNILLGGDRVVIAMRFERMWHLHFAGPKLEGDIDRAATNLSPKAMCAIMSLSPCLVDPVQQEKDWGTFFASVRKASTEGAKLEG